MPFYNFLAREFIYGFEWQQCMNIHETLNQSPTKKKSYKVMPIPRWEPKKEGENSQKCGKGAWSEGSGNLVVFT